MDRLEIIANPSKKERMTSWTGRKFLQNPVSSLSPGLCARILRPSEKENPTVSTHHTTITTITHHVAFKITEIAGLSMTSCALFFDRFATISILSITSCALLGGGGHNSLAANGGEAEYKPQTRQYNK